MACRNLESVIAVLAESAVAAFSIVYTTLDAFPSTPRIGLQCPGGDEVAACLFLAGYPLSHSLRRPLVAGTLQIDRP
jgi:hypothetical protein